MDGIFGSRVGHSKVLQLVDVLNKQKVRMSLAIGRRTHLGVDFP